MLCQNIIQYMFTYLEQQQQLGLRAKINLKKKIGSQRLLKMFFSVFKYEIVPHINTEKAETL